MLFETGESYYRYVPKWGARIINFCILLMLCSTLTIEKGFGFFSLILILTSIVLLPLQRQKLPLTKYEKIWLLLLFGMFFSGFLSFWFKDPHLRGWSYLDLPSRFLLVIPFYLYIRRVYLSERFFWMGISLGGLGSGLAGLYQYYQFGYFPVRAAANHHILYGDLSICLAFLSLLGYPFFNKLRFNYGKILSIAGFLGGMLGALLSTSRGSWLALPVLVGVLVCINRDKISSRLLVAACCAPVVIFTVLYIMPHSMIKQRIDAIFVEVHGYFDHQETQTSIGARFEMYRGAWMIFEKNPVFGAGTGTYEEEVLRLQETKQIQALPEKFNQPHNEFLHVLATRGLVGFFAVAALFIFPLWYFLRARHYKTLSYLSQAGIVLYVSYLEFAITESILNRMLSLMFFLIISSIVIVFLQQRGMREKDEKIDLSWI